ncbi:hypothetical protein IEQ34_004626 [Dendrobium chrysotoxum]|uniref:Uncharacterized protein n=1 Tax=Dendrobium chrysotoxum TaxID=161865 RepID=A0AAV7HIW1_DENCH|nr:hypothetical protein IEQ34_004626 [Dendrobium chrysotoxum]
MALCCNNSPFDCLLLDLDDTLYPLSLGISQACKKNIDEFLAMKCGLPIEQASSLRVELFKKYGSSLAGLMALGYEVHPDEYHSFVHGLLPYEKIRPDSQLRELLLSIPQTKIVIFSPFVLHISILCFAINLLIISAIVQIFTNSDRKHASRVLERLCIEEECFQKIICFETLNPQLFENKPTSAAARQPPTVVLKPFIAAVEAAIDIAGFEPHRTLFLDDSEKNIAAGKAVGLRTALVGRSTKTKEADYAMESITSLRQTIPEIWEGEQAKKSVSGELTVLKVRNELDAIRPTTAPIQA